MRPVLLGLLLLVCALSAQETPSGGGVRVPLDSPVYPALERLAALGYVPSQIAGLKPWSRSECLRQVAEASRLAEKHGGSDEVLRQLAFLRHELRVGARAASIDAIELRAGAIAGPVLNDGMHFGQTWVGDSGRPFGRGWNGYAGVQARADKGRWFGYLRGEYQHGAGLPSYGSGVRELIGRLDGVPYAPRSGAVDRVRAVEAYGGVRLRNVTVSVGKQALWWGPSYGLPLSFSDNAEPPLQLRVATESPVALPLMGRARVELVIGRLEGHTYPAQPWFNGQKFSFKLTDNLEMGFTRWSLMWGEGRPMTVRSLWRNLVSTRSSLGDFSAADPGDRKGGFDFKYRVPGVRRWLTLYSDSYSDDDPSPLAAPRRAAINPGVHLVHVPSLPKLDVRLEAPSTMPMNGDYGPHFIYYNSQYRNGNTNDGYLLGSWAGRDGRGLQGWLGYQVSPEERVEFSYRHLKIGSRFLPGGGTQSSGSLKAQRRLSPKTWAEGFVQYERFLIPVLGSARRNLSCWLRLRWEPFRNAD